MNKILSGLSWSFAEKIMTDFMEALISIVLARLLLPEDYGLVSLVQIFITITSIVVSNGLGNALIQRKDADEEQISTIFYLNALVGVLFYIVLYFSAPYLASIKRNKDLVVFIRVLALKVPIASVYSIQHAYIKKRMQFRLFFFSSLGGTVLAGVVGVSMALMGYGAWALIVSTLTDQIMDCVILFITSKWFPKPIIKIKKSKPIIVFGCQILITQFISRAYGQLRSLLQGVKYTGADLAFDVKGKKIPNMILNAIDPSIARVLSPVLSEMQDDRNSMKNIVRKAMKYYSFFIFPILIGISLTASSFIPLLFTRNWMEAVPYVQVYCLVLFMNALIFYDDKVIEACGIGKMLIKINMLNVIFDISVISVTIFVFNNPLSLACSSVITSIFNILIHTKCCKSLINYSLLDHIRDVFPAFIASLIMGLCVFSINAFMTNGMLMLITKISVGLITYILLSAVFNRQLLKYMFKMVYSTVKLKF